LTNEFENFFLSASSENKNRKMIFLIYGNTPRSVNNLNGGTYSNITNFKGIGIMNGIIGIGIIITKGTKIITDIHNANIHDKTDNTKHKNIPAKNNTHNITYPSQSEPKNSKSNRIP
jgi:hypothetical protein